MLPLRAIAIQFHFARDVISICACWQYLDTALELELELAVGQARDFVILELQVLLPWVPFPPAQEPQPGTTRARPSRAAALQLALGWPYLP